MAISSSFVIASPLANVPKNKHSFARENEMMVVNITAMIPAAKQAIIADLEQLHQESDVSHVAFIRRLRAESLPLSAKPQQLCKTFIRSVIIGCEIPKRKWGGKQ